MNNEFRGLVPYQKVLVSVEGRVSKDVLTFLGTDKPDDSPVVLDHHGNMVTTEWDKIEPFVETLPFVVKPEVSYRENGSRLMAKDKLLGDIPLTHRRELLQEATEIITKDRNNSYGEPDQDFTRIAQLWNTYLADKETIESHDVAVMMILLKVSRLSWNPSHKDSWLDVAGYAACGYETEILRRDS